MAFALATKPREAAATSRTAAPRAKSAPGHRAVDARFGVVKPVSRFTPPKPAVPPIIQTKLKVGEPNDEFEQEADDVAEEIMRATDGGVADPRPQGIEGRRPVSAVAAPNGALAARFRIPVEPWTDGQLARLSARQGPLLQRKCACGGDCDDCREQRAPGVQAKPKVNEPGDIYEREADRVAQLVTGMSGPDSTVQTLPTDARQDEPDLGDSPVGPETLTHGGLPLSPSVRRFYERQFGRDFTRVRVHCGPEADTLNESLRSHAFTFGEHIWLANGQRPESSFVMAHELAHVVQQRQPPRPHDETHRIEPVYSLLSQSSTGDLSIQRLPFFVPLNLRKGKLSTGTDIHKEILSEFEDLEIEAPVPNAVRNDYGLGYQGEADLYRASNGRTVGVYFAGPRGEKHPGAHQVTPKPHRAAKRRHNSPEYAGKDKLANIEGPREIWLNELKPANPDMLTAAEAQLVHYRNGFLFARDWTNKWAELHDDKAKGRRWTLEEGDINIDQQLGQEPKPVTKQLALVDLEETAGEGRKKFDIKKVQYTFIPYARSGRSIPGKLYLKYRGKGVWMYYARPDDMAQALGLPTGRHRQHIQAAMQTAILVQENLIGDLKKAPTEAAALRRERHGTARHADPRSKPSPIVRTTPLRSPAVQRKGRKPAKLKDDFDFSKWNRLRENLGEIVRKDLVLERVKGTRGHVETERGGQAFAYLEFVELAVKAEKAVEGAGEKSDFLESPELTAVADLTPKDKGGTPRKLKHSPLELYSWMERWTSKPVEILGRLRQSFKGVFVRLANMVSGHGQKDKDSLLTRIKTKLKKLFEKLSKGKGGSALANLAIKGLVIAIRQLGDLLLPSVIRMLAAAIKAGIRKKVEAIFELEAGSLVESTFGRFKTWMEKIHEFGATFRTIFDRLIGSLDGIKDFIETFHKIVNYITTAADIVKWGIRAVQCSGIVSCLTLLLEPVKEWAIKEFGDWALTLCNVRYLLAKGIHRFFSDLPETIAGGILTILKDNTPPALGEIRDIFAEKIEPEPIPEPSEIEDYECSGIDLGFSLFEGFRTSKPKPGTLGEKTTDNDVEALQEFSEAVGPDKLEPLTELMKKMGITDATPLTRDTLEQLKGLLDGVDPKELKEVAEGKASEAVAKKLEPLVDALGEKARAESAAPKPGKKKKAPRVKRQPVPRVTIPAEDTGVIEDRPWDKTALHIKFVEGELEPGKRVYEESPVLHTRLSADKPEYLIWCSPSGYFSGSVFFFADYVNVPRPMPFTPPAATLQLRAGNRTLTAKDDNPVYDGPGNYLRTSFDPLVEIEVHDKEKLEMQFVLHDKDTSTTLTYEDKMKVGIDPCL